MLYHWALILLGSISSVFGQGVLRVNGGDVFVMNFGQVAGTDATSAIVPNFRRCGAGNYSTIQIKVAGGDSGYLVLDKESYENLNQEVDDAFIQWYISPVSNQKVDVFSIECGTGNVLFKEPQLSFVQDRNGNILTLGTELAKSKFRAIVQLTYDVSRVDGSCFYSPDPNARVCSILGGVQACDPGFTPHAGVCEQVAPNSYSSDGINAVACPKGQTSVAGSSDSSSCESSGLIPCLPGSTRSLINNECQMVPAGSYSSDGLTSDLCAPGMFTDSEGSFVCRSCSAGTFSSALGRNSNCSPCSSISFSSSDGATKCAACSEIGIGNATCNAITGRPTPLTGAVVPQVLYVRAAQASMRSSQVALALARKLQSALESAATDNEKIDLILAGQVQQDLANRNARLASNLLTSAQIARPQRVCSGQKCNNVVNGGWNGCSVKKKECTYFCHSRQKPIVTSRYTNCLDTENDPNNCGAKGVHCPTIFGSASVCTAGVCNYQAPL